MSATRPRGSPKDVGRDLSIDPARAAILATPISFATLALVLVPHQLLWGENALKALYRATGGFGFAAAIVGGIVLHEAIHAATWAVAGRLRWRDLRFGVQWRVLMPYAHPLRPLSARAYAVGAAAPGVLLGVLPSLVGVASGRGVWSGWGGLFLAAASGDLLVLFSLRGLPASAGVRDHPSRVGCETVARPDRPGSDAGTALPRRHSLEEVPGSFAIVQLPAGADIPAWALAPGEFCAAVRTPGELSVVAPQERVPEGPRAAPGWACLRVEGAFELTETGVLASLAAPLAAAGVSLFALSTFDTDYLLVRRDQLTAARDALESAGHGVRLRSERP